MADPVEFIITLVPGVKADTIAEALHARGFASTSVLGELSMIVGTADPASKAALAAIEGVSAVEPSTPIQLPPGDPQ
jgi:hypothetical protein